jgi:hypothetical protein
MVRRSRQLPITHLESLSSALLKRRQKREAKKTEFRIQKKVTAHAAPLLNADF